jgi:hypothetical protein
MALHTELPIYKKAQELFDVCVRVAENLPRNLKRLIGEKMVEDSHQILTMIQVANMVPDKGHFLMRLVVHIGRVQVAFRTLFNRRIVLDKQFSDAAALTDAVFRQANAWRSHFKSVIPVSSPAT